MKKIPSFKTTEEARIFWENHDFTDFAQDTEEAKIKFARPRKAQLTFRLDPEDVTALKKIAHDKGLSYTSLVRMWVKEKLAG